MSSSLPTHQSGFASSPALSQGPLQPPTHRYSFLLSTSQMWTPCQWQAVDPRSRSPRCFESVTELSTECWPSSVFHRKKNQGDETALTGAHTATGWLQAPEESGTSGVQAVSPVPSGLSQAAVFCPLKMLCATRHLLPTPALSPASLPLCL